MRYVLYLITGLILTSYPLAAQSSWPELKLNKAYSLRGIDKLQASGLTRCGSDLLFISDRHDQSIFKIKLNTEDEFAEVQVAHKLSELPWPPQIWNLPIKNIFRGLSPYLKVKGLAYDWEGITCDSEKNIYLASELYINILKLKVDGTSAWLETNLYEEGMKQNLFKKHNAFIEGVTWSQHNRLFVAAERSERALISLDWQDQKREFDTLPSKDPGFEHDIFDLAGLSEYQGKLYTLERSRYLVCQRGMSQGAPKQCYSFRKTALDPRWAYTDQRYGLAEGLLVEKDSIWIIFDNNDHPRVSDAEDRRPLLLRFDHP